MRLINTYTLETIEVDNGEKIPYAILSHRWDAKHEELSYQEIMNVNFSQDTKQKAGFEKLRKTCEIARTEYSQKYVWIDTCCIDKSSSAELSQAINSMFRWYKEAEVCIAFLKDVTADTKDITSSEWFRRGWTLQELIAPKEVVFFDQDWQRLGTKESHGSLIYLKTGISAGILSGAKSLDEYPIAVRMSWASQRKTKHPEDLAYSLLGIFDVNMTMIYGEGSKAFIRLQEKLLKQSSDMSIFAWCDANTTEHGVSGLLATSPAQFAGMNNIEPSYESPPQDLEFSVTNRGIRFSSGLFFSQENGDCALPLWHERPFEDIHLNRSLRALDECPTASTRLPENRSDVSQIVSFGGLRRSHIGIPLRRVNNNYYVRAQSSNLIPLTGRIPQQLVFRVAKTLTTPLTSLIANRKIRIEEPIDLLSPNFQLEKVSPVGSWSAAERAMYVGQSRTFVGIMQFHPTWSDDCGSFIIFFSFDESQFGLSRCYWNVAIKEAKRAYHRGPQIPQISSLEDVFDDSPMSWGNHGSKTTSIELNSRFKPRNDFCKQVQVSCAVDDMGMSVKITVAHRDGNDTETL